VELSVRIAIKEQSVCQGKTPGCFLQWQNSVIGCKEILSIVKERIEEL
jgi:hypothetical protein